MQTLSYPSLCSTFNCDLSEIVENTKPQGEQQDWVNCERGKGQKDIFGEAMWIKLFYG